MSAMHLNVENFDDRSFGPCWIVSHRSDLGDRFWLVTNDIVRGKPQRRVRNYRTLHLIDSHAAICSEILTAVTIFEGKD